MSHQVNSAIANDPMYKFLIEKNRLMNRCISEYHKGKETLDGLSQKLTEIAKEITKFTVAFTTTQWQKFKAIKEYVDCIEPVQTDKKIELAKNQDLEKLEKNALETVQNSKDQSRSESQFVKPAKEKENSFEQEP